MLPNSLQRLKELLEIIVLVLEINVLVASISSQLPVVGIVMLGLLFILFFSNKIKSNR